MKNQVTTIEQSKRLMALGVPTKKASMVWREWIYQHFDKDVIDEVKYELDVTESRQRDPEESDIPAYTVADLLEMMPEYIPDANDQRHDYCLTLYHCFCWNLCYENRGAHRTLGDRVDFDLINLLCDSIEWLVSNGYELEV